MAADKKNEKIISRILKNTNLNISTLLEGKLKRNDLQSLMLVMYENISKKTTAKNIAEQYKESRFLKPCDISQRELLQFDNLLYGIVPVEFETLELSPVLPFGTNSTLTKINQKNILSSVRNVEVLADITTALALECARERRSIIQNNHLDNKNVHACSTHRSIRLQKFPDELGFTPHFKVFGACSAGRDIGHEKFESENLIKHVSIYLDLLTAANKKNYQSQKITVYFSDISIVEKLIKNLKINRGDVTGNTQTIRFDFFKEHQINLPGLVSSLNELPGNQTNFPVYFALLEEIEKKAVEKLKKKYSDILFLFDLKRVAGIGYYENLCFKITAENKRGKVFPLADGGMTDWTKKILSSKKERLFISGFGTELFCRNFKPETF